MKRYRVEGCQYGCPHEEEPDGEWVLWDDVEGLVRELSERRKMPPHMLYTHSQMVELCDEAREQGRRGLK